MSDDMRRCDTCGALVSDPLAETCPHCYMPLASSTLVMSATPVWDAIDDGWGTSSEGLAPEGGGEARTLVGMGLADIEAFEASEGALEDLVAPAEGATMPLPQISDLSETPPPLPEAESTSPPRARRASSVSVPEFLAPGEVALPDDAEDPQGLATIPLVGFSISSAVPSPVVASAPSPASLPAGRGRGGAGLPTLPPEGMPDFSKGLETLDMPSAVELVRTLEAETSPAVSDASQDGPGDASDGTPDVGVVAETARKVLPRRGVSPDLAAVAERGKGEASSSLSPSEAAVGQDDASAAAFGDRTVDISREPYAASRGLGAGLLVLWVVAVASVVAALIVLLLL